MLNALRHHRYSYTIGLVGFIFSYCAQRLTASQVQLSSSIEIQRSVTKVLNALRHHRYSYAFVVVYDLLDTRAQRLTASQVQLSASRVHEMSDSFVLNALRHHRYSYFKRKYKSKLLI